jgi:hypothetical protein
MSWVDLCDYRLLFSDDTDFGATWCFVALA